MIQTLLHLNYLAVLVAAVAGFMLGWLWYSPVLFVKVWMAEMKITEETMKAAAAKGMAFFFLQGFTYTLVSTFALAALIAAHRSAGALAGAELGAFVGLLVVGARMLNGSVWEQRSVRLMAILVGHEVALFALQGAILGAWH